MNKSLEPDWYWSRGLHDATVTLISEKEIEPNYCQRLPLYNFLELQIDSKHALFEKEITKIRFYNYKLKGFEAKLPNVLPLFWISDTIEQISENKFEIKIELVTEKDKHKFIHMTFQTAKVYK